MWPDVIDLRNFYSTRLGHVARRLMRRKVRKIWPKVKGKNVMALGYPTPFLRYYREEAKRLVALMPAEQGALSWTEKTPNIVVLTEETLLPLPDKSIDLVLVVHALEFTSSPKEMIREVWRVLSDGGRLLLIVPNRSGIWSRMEKTPFGHGHTYSLSQVNQFLSENMFTPLDSENALYIPPTQSRILLSLAPAFEKIGYKWFRNVSGVLLVEASKQVYGGNLTQEVTWDKKLQLAKKLVQPVKN